MAHEQNTTWHLKLTLTVLAITAIFSISQSWAEGAAFKCKQVYDCKCGCGLNGSNAKDYHGCVTFWGTKNENETDEQAKNRCCAESLTQASEWCRAFGKEKPAINDPISACNVKSVSCKKVSIKETCRDVPF